MCGISGIWGMFDRHAVESMVKAMRHRGPDDSGIFQDDRIALGMTRLAIIDLSPKAHQPMSNAEGNVWIVYNGETYNFREEREILLKKGYSFRSTSDTEVVLKMYEEYGDDFLLRMRGIFALAIYDKRRGPGKERLLLARDQLGIKPLLHAKVGSTFLFASELKAVLASGLVQPEIDPVALRTLLAYGSVYQPRTMLAGVNMLLPAHRMVIESGIERTERYWSLGLDRHPGMRARSYDELVDEVGAILSESVQLQLVSDVPVGAFLSGGVDSTFLVGLMTRVAGRRIKTFSVGFEAEGKYIDESGDAERTSRFLGSDHTRLIVRGIDVRDEIKKIASSLDQPSVDGVNSYFVSKAARQAVTVAISGTGGDEVFAGYPWFAQMIQYGLQKGRQPLKTAGYAFWGKIASLRAFRWLFGRWTDTHHLADDKDGFLVRYGSTYQIFGVEGASAILSPAVRHDAGANNSLVNDLKEIDELPSGAVVDRVTALCLRGYTNNQLLRDIDAVSMAHSLEVRVPYLDVPLIDLALSLPASAKIGDVDVGINPYQASYRETGCKKVLIDAGRKMGILPEDIDCQPKRGFSMPFDLWLRGPLADVLEDTLSAETTGMRGLLEVKRAGKVKKDFLNGKIGWAQPWLLMIIELWCREVLDSIDQGRDL
jgi:asparagine synthase (glutamine-hydrolysing)